MNIGGVSSILFCKCCFLDPAKTAKVMITKRERERERERELQKREHTK
jgi:hypothetical protein